MSGPYLKFLPAQWFAFSRANPHLFEAKLQLRDGLEADGALRNYRERVIESARAYGLWRAVLDFEDRWLTEEDQLEVGRFLTEAELDPGRFALEEAKGLAQAVKRFALPPLRERVLDVIRQLDERLGDVYEQDAAHDMIIDGLAALNCGPTRVQVMIDRWLSRDLVTAEEHEFVTDFFERAGFSAPDYVRIRRNASRGIVVPEAAIVD